MFFKDVGRAEETPSKLSYRSYFAVIPVFRKRQESRTERNVIKIIHKSNICKSSPILKTLLIENVRICCIVVESSGKQSSKIICASAPYILSLICKASPKFEAFLKNEKVSSCLDILKQTDFESILNNIYHTTVIIHTGAKKLYPAIHVSFMKDFLSQNKESLLYLLKYILNLLQSAGEFLYENTLPFIQYLYHQNYAFVSYISDAFPKLIAALIKYSIASTVNSKKILFTCLRYMKRVVLGLICFTNKFYTDSLINQYLKELYLFLKQSLLLLHSSDAYKYIEQTLLELFYYAKPYFWDYLQKLSEVLKDAYKNVSPFVKNTVQHVIKEGIPLLRKFIDDNLGSIVNAYHFLTSFLNENIHYIKPFCCRTCRFLYDCISCLYNILQVILPYVIQFYSNNIISLINFSTSVFEQVVCLCKVFLNYILHVIQNRKIQICHLSQNAIKALKTFCGIILKLQPYMVLIFRAALYELARLIHIASPTLFASLREVNSSLFYASKDLVAKSYLAVKCITPSVYYSIKTVAPPTVVAMREVIKSSKNSILIVSPAILRGMLTIRPEIEDAFIVLISDGNKACFEIISVSYSASCQLKDVAKFVSFNIPLFYKAIREVLTTTSCAAIEVSTTSLNAKSRMLKDFERARKTVHTSLSLAEQEVASVYADLVLEMNSIVPVSQRNISKASTGNTYFGGLLRNSFSRISENVANVSYRLKKISMLSFQGTSKTIIDIICYIYLFACTFGYSILKLNASKMRLLGEKISPLFCHVTAFKFEPLMNIVCNELSDIDSKIILHICASISKAWYTFKFAVRATWNKVCEMAPKIWNTIERLASIFWNFTIENIPGAWLAWKIFCSLSWQLTNDLAPHFWHSFSRSISIFWSSGRNVIVKSWNFFIYSASYTWLHATSCSSDFWLVSKAYLPDVWFTGCEKTKKGWKTTCSLTESCWSFTVETCILYWNVLHRAVARSWKTGVVSTKTAYGMVSTSGSVLQKSIFVCIKTKNYVYVILPRTPHTNLFSLDYFKVPKFRSFPSIAK